MKTENIIDILEGSAINNYEFDLVNIATARIPIESYGFTFEDETGSFVFEGLTKLYLPLDIGDNLKVEIHKRDIASGEVKDLQKAIIEIDRAAISLSLAGEVKNKVLAAYKEIMNTQV